ncbi:MAG TPA: hypothetical protein PLO62_07250 [Candidatus Hydrogenedentes bacterium]|nr:hypothetical protein [Candidatus Hydrogenedentota bacterium]
MATVTRALLARRRQQRKTGDEMTKFVTQEPFWTHLLASGPENLYGIFFILRPLCSLRGHGTFIVPPLAM